MGETQSFSIINMNKYQIYFTATGSFIVEAKDQDEAEEKAEKELFDLGFSPKSEQSNLVDDLEITDTQRLCDNCEEPQDDDGRCGCTNNDSK